MAIFSKVVKAQSDSVKYETYYEIPQSTSLKEVYYVLKDAPGVIHGPYILYYQDGAKKAEGVYINGEPKGIWKFYFENGHLKRIADRENAGTGSWKYFYESGGTRIEGNLVDKQKNGTWKYFYEEGSLRSKGNFEEGKKTGIWYYYAESGYLQSDVDYTKEEVVTTRNYYPSGKVKSTGFLKNNQGDSTWVEYYESGKISGTGTEKNGMKNGIWAYYNENGTLKSKGSYKDNEQYGSWKYYDGKGQLAYEGAHKDGKRMGEWIYMFNGEVIGSGDYVDGTGKYIEYYAGTKKVKISGQMKDDHRDSTWLFYAENGDLVRRCNFDRDTAECTGFHPNGEKRTEGKMVGASEVGTWPQYDEGGNRIGFKKFGFDAQNDSLDGIKDTAAFVWEDFAERKEVYPGRIKTKFPKKHKFKWWNKWGNNEVKGLGLGISPFLIFNGQLSLSFEYYIEKRLASEFGGTYIWNPWFETSGTIQPDQLLTTGNDFFFRQKFFFEQESKPISAVQRRYESIWYWGGEVRYITESYDFALENSMTSSIDRYVASGQKVQLLGVIGGKVIRPANQAGFYFDFNFALGGGYNQFSENFTSNTETDRILSVVRRKQFNIPFRLNFTLGFLFL